MPPSTGSPRCADPAGRPRWLLIARAIDHLGDTGILWRLARQLAHEHGIDVTLTTDDPAALAGFTGVAAITDGTCIDRVRIRLVAAAPDSAALAAAPDVVVTGLDVTLPPALHMPVRAGRTQWIGYQYLSAERWVDDFHALASTKADGCTERFWFPGFGERTGGLLRERTLAARREAFQRTPAASAAFRDALGIDAAHGTTVASLFAYADAPLAALHRLVAAAGLRWHWVACRDALAPALRDALSEDALARDGAGRVGVSWIPFLTHDGFDRLLWSCDVNFVRGEDSWIRALWAARPLVWHAYRQADRLHLDKLRAFEERAGRPALAPFVRWWNADPSAPVPEPGALAGLVAPASASNAALQRLHAQQLAQTDLATRLVAFAATHAGERTTL